jgi:hypothetical protein
MALIADRNGKIISDEEIIGGIIDPSDPFWNEEHENGLTTIQNMIWHQSYHSFPVTFGRKDEWEKDDKRGSGYFRLAFDTSNASGSHRWMIVEFLMSDFQGQDHHHVKETFDRMKNQGWDIWCINEIYRDGYGGQPRRRMVLFIVSPVSIEEARFRYRVNKCIMGHLRERLIHNNNRSPLQPSRQEEINMMPLPCMAHGIIGADVKIQKL